MAELLLKCIITGLFYGLVVFYHKTDRLETDKIKLTVCSILCLCGLLFLSLNAYFLYCVLVFHTYTDECTTTTYVLPTLVAGLTEVVLLLINGITVSVALELVVCIAIVHVLSLFRAFASGDAYYLNVLLTGACVMGISSFRALFVIFYVACISFVIRMVVRNVARRIRGEGIQRKYAFMGSILCGYVVFCVAFVGV